MRVNLIQFYKRLNKRGHSLPPIRFGRILLQPPTCQLNRLLTKSTCVDRLFTCHVVGWRKIPSNRGRGKLFP
jgi:hypothetical protein